MSGRQGYGAQTRGRWLRPRLSVIRFVLIYALATIGVFHWPLILRALPHVQDVPLTEKVISIGSFLLLSAFLTILLLTGLSFISKRVLKVVAAILVVINAAAFYFITLYGIVIDEIIVRNVFVVDTKTWGELYHPLFLVYLLVLGVLPAFVILRTEFIPTRRRARLLFAGLSTALFAGFTLPTSYVWLWMDQHMPELGSLTLPWSYVINLSTYARAELRANRPQELLPDAVLPPLEDGQREVVILMVGEAARAANFTAYGYDRETTPYTADLPIAALPNAWSCGTYTFSGTACIMGHLGVDASINDPYETLPTYLSRHGVETIWRSNSPREPRVFVDHYEKEPEVRALCGGDCPSFAHEDWLVWGLGERIAASDSQRIFIVLHQGDGSHGPSYFAQYPPTEARFGPICETVRVQTCSYQELLNAYDNTIVYTDRLMADLIGQLQALPDIRSTLIYVSDHGQSLGEDGIYLHGMPNSIAPDVQREIPIFVWMNAAFQTARNVDEASVVQGEQHGHENIFHSVLGAFGANSPVYRSELDIFARQR